MMKNRILSITRNTVPYVKELRPYAKSITGCILMQQLDYWFEKYPDGYYKFLAPAPNNRHYKPGKSWGEELAISEKEFHTAFSYIGVAYTSKTQYEDAADKFQGKFYCSYFDRKEGVTHYFRSHVVVDSMLSDMCENVDTRDYSNRPMGVYRNSQQENTETPIVGLPSTSHIRSAYAGTEIKEETTEEKQNVCVRENENFTASGISRHGETTPSVESPLAKEIRKVCKRTTIVMAPLDHKALIDVLRGLEAEGATVEQVQAFGRKVKHHWIGRGNHTPKISQVLEFWQEVLEIDENQPIGDSNANGDSPAAGGRHNGTGRSNNNSGNSTSRYAERKAYFAAQGLDVSLRSGSE